MRHTPKGSIWDLLIAVCVCIGTITNNALSRARRQYRSARIVGGIRHTWKKRHVRAIVHTGSVREAIHVHSRIKHGTRKIATMRYITVMVVLGTIIDVNSRIGICNRYGSEGPRWSP